jgi:hypothetical protein
MKEKEPKHLLENTLLIGTLGLISLLAFSKKSRQIIYERDGGKCVICGGVEWLECCHIDHSKKNPRYDDPSNGDLRCVPDHLMDHINREGRNGLPVHQNRFGIKMMIEKIKHKYHGETDQ